ncbi:MAG TPA: phage tail protein [Solirubrobacteraceae bacterium]|nr:phage tail protein [Solirubrobacteraceae bacterium]
MAPNTVAGQSASNGTGSIPDPLPQLTFLVEISGVTIGQFSECTGLSVEYDVMEYAEGGNNEFVHKLRGRARYPTISLRRGVTSQDALLKWFFDGPDADQLTITLMDEKASAIRTFGFASPFPIKWSGPDVSSGSNGAAMESLEIGHKGMVG